MRWIQKGPEPWSLKRYRNKKDATWDDCPTDVKNDIRDALKAEQGHLCAYCMRRIQGDGGFQNMKIEHWKPRSKFDEAGDEAGKLDYQNMLGVCEGLIDGKNGKEIICDTKKGGEEITADPRRRDRIETIDYQIQNGEGRVKIRSADNAVNEDLEERLNLNAVRLQENRYKALSALIQKISKVKGQGTWPPGLLDSFRRRYETPNKDGKLPEYAGFLLWWLNQRRRRT